MKSYVPLHVHSHYSLLDGLSKPDQIAQRCLNIGATSCALTDHGSISGAVAFYQSMKKSNIKPILGCELYICQDLSTNQSKENGSLSHMLVLAKNQTGWKNLISLVSASNDPSRFYRKPRTSINELEEMDTSGLICITGHLGSNLANTIDNGSDLSTASNLIEQLKSIFGNQNVFLEAQLMDKNHIPFQITLTDIVRNLAKKHNLKVIATPDAHYANKEDAIDQRVLLCNTLKTTFPDINKKLLNNEDVALGCFFKSDNFYILSDEEMRHLHTEEELYNTRLVSDMCEDYNILNRPQLPRFIDNEDEYLRQLCREGWRKRGFTKIPESEQQIYIDRIKQELSVLQGAGLSGYFLIVQDIVNYIRTNNWLPGPGRGSAAGCLVSYLLEITNIDPIKYDLLFERFYNAGRNSADRISMPDIDIDVPMTARDNVIGYIKNKYGANKVSQMITFNTMKGRGALKEVLRVYGGLTYEEMNQITKHIPDEAKIADDLQEMKDDRGESSIIQWSLENMPEKFKEWCKIEEDGSITGLFAKRFEQAIRLEGTKSNQSKHAAGIAISAHNLDGMCPMVYDSKTGNSIAGMEMQDLESLGIVKFDILGIGMLDKIMCIQSLLKGKNYAGISNNIC
jgi:DNA polymerase-3 subunit alpha